MSQISRNILSSTGRSSSLYPTLRQRRTAQTFELRVRRRSGTRTSVNCGSFIFPLRFYGLKVSFSLVQPSSHLILCLYAKRSAHPDILIGTHEMPIPLGSQRGSFCREFPFVQSIEHLACRYPLCPRERRWESYAVDAAGHPCTYELRSTLHLRTRATAPHVYQPKITIVPPMKLLYRDAFNSPSPNIFHRRRITNPSKLAILCRRVGKRWRLLVPGILVLLSIEPVNL